MARVHVVICTSIPQCADDVFAALIDWPGHADWVPLTRVRIESGDGGVGTVFVATTGIGPASLPDRMRVDALDAQQRSVQVTKIGPILTGTVDITVQATADQACTVTWIEDITVPVLPALMTRPVAAATKRGFESSLNRLARHLAARQRVVS